MTVALSPLGYQSADHLVTTQMRKAPMRLLTAPTRALINKLLGTRHTSPAPTPDPHTTAPRDKHRHRPTHKLDLSDCECRRPPF